MPVIVIEWFQKIIYNTCNPQHNKTKAPNHFSHLCRTSQMEYLKINIKLARSIKCQIAFDKRALTKILKLLFRRWVGIGLV